MFFRIGTKSGEKKSYEPKWESCKNVGTKKGFIPLNFKQHGIWFGFKPFHYLKKKKKTQTNKHKHKQQ